MPARHLTVRLYKARHEREGDRTIEAVKLKSSPHRPISIWARSEAHIWQDLRYHLRRRNALKVLPVNTESQPRLIIGGGPERSRVWEIKILSGTDSLDRAGASIRSTLI